MIRVSVRSTRPPGTATATFKLALIAARRDMLRHWHREFLPIHFTLAANKRYGYQPRKGDNEPPKLPRDDGKPGGRNNPHYSWVKRRKYHHNRPLVFTGASERVAIDPANFELREPSSNRSRGVFVGLETYWYRYHKGGVYFRRHRYGGKQSIVLDPQPNKAEELVRTIPDELAALATVGQRRVTEYVRHFRPPASGVA